MRNVQLKRGVLKLAVMTNICFRKTKLTNVKPKPYKLIKVCPNNAKKERQTGM